MVFFFLVMFLPFDFCLYVRITPMRKRSGKAESPRTWKQFKEFAEACWTWDVAGGTGWRWTLCSSETESIAYGQGALVPQSTVPCCMQPSMRCFHQCAHWPLGMFMRTCDCSVYIRWLALAWRNDGGKSGPLASVVSAIAFHGERFSALEEFNNVRSNVHLLAIDFRHKVTRWEFSSAAW